MPWNQNLAMVPSAVSSITNIAVKELVPILIGAFKQWKEPSITVHCSCCSHPEQQVHSR